MLCIATNVISCRLIYPGHTNFELEKIPARIFLFFFFLSGRCITGTQSGSCVELCHAHSRTVLVVIMQTHCQKIKDLHDLWIQFINKKIVSSFLFFSLFNFFFFSSYFWFEEEEPPPAKWKLQPSAGESKALRNAKDCGLGPFSSRESSCSAPTYSVFLIHSFLVGAYIIMLAKRSPAGRLDSFHLSS